jgi:hypothetical protein
MKTMTIAAGASAILLALGAPAGSQAQPPLPTDAAPTATAALPATDAPTARKLALAREVIAATGSQKAMEGMFQNVMSQVAATAGKKLPPGKQEKMRIIAEAESHALDRMIPQIIQTMTQAYAANFTEQELTDILAFYQSPTGRSMVAKTPELMRSVMGGMLAMMPQMQREMGEEICAKTTCTAAEKNTYLGKAPATP